MPFHKLNKNRHLDLNEAKHVRGQSNSLMAPPVSLKLETLMRKEFKSNI